jgi:predicted RNase H-like nuclease (RuvC/YqgF family)
MTNSLDEIINREIRIMVEQECNQLDKEIEGYKQTIEQLKDRTDQAGKMELLEAQKMLGAAKATRIHLMGFLERSMLRGDL